MTKSSEVLRLAAEYAFVGKFTAISLALEYFFMLTPTNKMMSFVSMTEYQNQKEYIDRCTALCLAAAMAESEGD